MLERLKQQARRAAAATYALYIAAQDPRTPWYARWLAGFVVAYALSPVDLIPDFIPVLGYVDDLVFVPIGVAIAVLMIPKPVWQESREKARDAVLPGPRSSRAVIAVVASIWLAFGVIALWLGFVVFA